MTNESLEKSKIVTKFCPWSTNENVIWLASTLSLHRNIEKFNFPHKLEIDRKKHILSLVTQGLLSNKGLKKPFAIKAQDVSPTEKNFLLEHFLIFEGFQGAHASEGFVLDDTGCFIALINVRDHIRLQYTDVSGNLEKGWNELSKIENALHPVFNFAFSEKFGFLTADSTLAGTGLSVTAYLHVPALIHLGELPEVTEKDKNEAVIATGMQGNPDDLIGDILTLKNSYTLGVNEENIISTIRGAVLKYVIAEKSARNKIVTEGSPAIKDKISRALGTLQFSYQLETIEAMAALSLLKLGIELEWIKGMTVQEVNQLFFTIRRAHLNYYLKEKLENENVATKRAEFIHDKVKKCSLAF